MLTLHRVDFWSDKDHPISAFIALTPVGKLAPPKKPSPLLPVPDSSNVWQKKARIQDGVFHGVLRQGDPELITNLTPAGIDQLGWR